MRLCRIPWVVAIAVLVAAPIAAAAETWTLNIEHENTGSGASADGTAGVTIRARGTVTITAGAREDFHGTGELAVIITHQQPPNPYLSFTPLEGKGPISVVGRRDGTRLVLEIKGAEITCRGIMNIQVPARGREQQPLENAFDPSALGGTRSITLERREGASTRIEVASQSEPFAISAHTVLTLTGGSDIVPAPARGPQIASTPEQEWTLELDHQGDTTLAGAIQGGNTFRVEGSARFVIPPKDGPVSGRGAVTVTGSASYATPMPQAGRYRSFGTLLVEGRREGDTLVFTPQVKVETGTAEQSGVHSQVDAGEGVSIYDPAGFVVRMRLRDGESVSARHSTAVPGGGRYDELITWTLRGALFERWRITIDRHHVEHFLHEGAGSYHKRNGLLVHARQTVAVEIRDGVVERTSGSARLEKLRSYSNPPWAYACKSAATQVMGTGTDIDAERLDQAHWAKRFNPPKNSQDAALKRQWAAIMVRKTPFIFPEQFTPGAVRSGTLLSLNLPQPSGYVVGIYCKLDLAAVQAHGYKVAPGQLQETIDYQRRVFDPNTFTVHLEDGWTHADAPADALDRTILRVERMR